ncbi:MAG: glycerol dehydrogenase [Euryarchaeota archaeon]|nr:glycerol dehydrogenase [Euryarchaeota archaeon]
MAIQREVAHRVFAAEFNSSRVEVKGTDEKAPSYLVSPLGAKMNRVFLCGVLTEVENRAQDGEMWRARVSDPTGVFTVYAGQYQPEAAAVLAGLNPPQYVAVVGKCRTYEPEPGSVFISVRPESITVIDEQIRNEWVFEAAKQTRERIQAVKAATASGAAAPADLMKAGVPAHLAAGVQLAAERYGGDVDLAFFERSVRDALQFLLEDQGGLTAPMKQAPTAVMVPKPKAKGPGEEVEKKVLSYIEAMASTDEKGAQWDLIVGAGEKEKISEDQVEEALNALMDKGLIYEPILGRLKMT